MSLRLRLIRSVAMVLLGTLAFGALLTYWHAQQKIDRELSAAVAVAQSTAQVALEDAARAGIPREGLRRVVHAFDGNRHVRAMLIDPRNKVADTSTVRAPEADEAPPQWLSGVLDQPAKVVNVTLPASLMKFGTIVLESDQRSETAEVWEDMQLSLTTLTTFCLVILGLIYWMLGRALQPLSALSRSFEQVGRGDYATRVPERGPTELAHLCANFNIMADALGRSERRNSKLNEQLAAVQEEERAELARDLHDEVSPLLFSIDVDATAIRKSAESDNIEAETTSQHARAISQAVGQIKSQVKSILGRLRPAVLLDLGLSNAIENLVAYWEARRPHIKFELAITEAGWGDQLDAAIHGIVREALSNAMQHSNPQSVEIAVKEKAGIIAVRVTDDGGGLSEPSAQGSYGLLHMRERVVAKGGRFVVRNREDGLGVIVKAELPLPSTLSNNKRAQSKQHEAIAS